jgi:predicted enzyme related to lactoylglutathione lyase
METMTISYAPGQAMWIDLATTDVAGATAFYGTLFDWELEDTGPDSGGRGLLRKDGKMIAGIGPATDATRGTFWSVYFATTDADDSASRVSAGGGTVVVPPFDAGGHGRVAVFQDPAGAYFSVWQADGHIGMELVRAPGAVSWVELSSTDVDAVKGFYATVLGVATRDLPELGYTLFETEGTAVAGAMASPDDSSRWSVYFEVADCDVTADRALASGATELLRQDSPAGRFAFLVDPQGGAFGIVKPDPDFKP